MQFPQSPHCAVFLAALLIAKVVHADDGWPQFRGPTGQGIAEATGLPLQWSESENIVWKASIPGRGWSSPVILDGQLWLTTAVEAPLGPEERKKRVEGLPISDQLAPAAKVSL